jgi:Family of unknown function (DUF6588)
MKKVFTVLVISFFCSISVYSQIEDRFSELSETNISGYAKPLVTTLGTSMNSGGYYSADIPSFFGFSISFRGMYVFIPDEQKTFTPQLLDGYTADKTTPTIYGEKSGAYYAGPQGYITMPPGLNQSSIPLGYPQIAASFMGTEVMLRYLPKIDISDKNSVSMFGIGIQHEISRYIPLVPVDIAAQVLYSTFEITNLVDVTNIAFNVHASKTFGVITPYFGLQLESTKVDLTYDVKADPNNPLLTQSQTVKVSIDGANTFRTTFGASLQLAVIVLNIDYNLSSQSLFTGGLTFAF